MVVAANRPVPAMHDYSIDVWTTRQGLPHNSIRGIAQTPEGRMWFGTWEGLAGYNGLDFHVLDRGSQPGLLDNGVGVLFADEGGLWVGDSRGNVGFRNAHGELHYFPRPEEMPNLLIQAMARDHHGRLWLLYEGKGLARLDAHGKFQYFPPAPDSPLGMASVHMVADAQNRIWIGTFGGLAYQDGDGIAQHVPEHFGLPRGYVWPYLAPDGTLWIAAEDSIHVMRDGSPKFMYRLPVPGRITAMVQDRLGQLWVGTETQGVLRFGERGVEPLPGNRELPGGRITQLFEDAEGSIWVGASGGLFRLRETLFHNVTQNEGLSGDYVRAVLEDSRGRFWVGTASGLDWMDANGRIHVQPLPTASGTPPSVLSLAEDRAGGLWIGSYGDGVYRLGPDGSVRRYGTTDGLPHGNIRAIAEDAQGRIWLGTQRGVVWLEDGKVNHVAGENAPSGLTLALSVQPDGIWVGTIEGVRVLREDRIQRIDLDELGGGRSVFAFLDVGQDMWFVSDRGLYRYRNGALARVGREQGMPVDAMFQLVADRLGSWWITSNRGVLRTTQAELDAVADGRVDSIAVERYTEIDGMVSSQANGSSGPAAWVRRDGSVWVATSSGLSTVDPSRLPHLSARVPPPTVIERVTVDGKPLPQASLDGNTALPGGIRLSVDYVGLSYLMSERILYRTWLSGLDTGWVERGRQHAVEYIGLPPGAYQLRVSAAHPGGEWSEREATWTFHIEPFWWQRLDVRIGGVLAMLAALAGLYLLMVSRYRASNVRLARLVDERTSDLQHQTQRLLRADEEKSQLLEQLREQSEMFARQAREDALTGISNRRAFDQALALALSWGRTSNRPISLVMLDVDHFKNVNDHYSHLVGDAVLSEVGQLLHDAARTSDLSARLGGEEFAVLFSDATLEQALAACERLRAKFHAKSSWAGIEGLSITFSAGLVQWRPDTETEAELLKRVDGALYRAKQEGRNRICVG